MNIKNSLIGIFIFAIFIAIILYFVFPDDRKEVLDLNADYLPQGDNEIINISSDEGPNLENSNPNTNQIDLNDETTPVEKKPTPENNIINAGELTCSDITFFTYQNLLEIERANIRRGYFSREETKIYESYDDSTISELANQGDLLALELLGESLRRQRKHEEALEVFMSAAVFGSIHTVTHFTSSYDISARKFIVSGDEIKAVEHTVNSLAWYKFMGLRGDFIGETVLAAKLPNSIRELNAINKNIDKTNIMMLVEERALQIYNQLEKQREEKGLGKFDNSITDAEKQSIALSARFNKDDTSILGKEMYDLAIECGFY